jgi:hypothetical protein
MSRDDGTAEKRLRGLFRISAPAQTVLSRGVNDYVTLGLFRGLDVMNTVNKYPLLSQLFIKRFLVVGQCLNRLVAVGT